MRAIRTTTISILALGLLAGSGVGVAAQEDAPADPVEFTARWAPGPNVRPVETKASGGVTEYRGGAFLPNVLSEASDPRLAGQVSLAVNWNDYGARDGLRLVNLAYRVENEQGAWQQQPTINLRWPGEDNMGVVGVFVGEGAYDGLIAVFDFVDDPDAGGVWDLHGFIFEGELPPPPQPYIAE